VNDLISRLRRRETLQTLLHDSGLADADESSRTKPGVALQGRADEAAASRVSA